MAVMNKVMKGVLAAAGGIVGLVIVADVIDTESANFSGISQTVLDYFVPLLALGLLASIVAIWKFS